MTTTERFHRLAMVGILAAFVAACGPGPSAPETPADDSLTPVAAAKPTNAGKKPRKDEPAAEPEPTPTYAWYRLGTADDPDPLWRFGIDGDSMLLETDPSVAAWGTDYWGYWAEPFPFVDGAVYYVNGLTQTTYTFTPLSGGFDVSKTVVEQPYLGGEPTTTETHVGVFQPEG